MGNESISIGVIALGILALATLLAGHFSMGRRFSRRYRQTSLLGIRIRTGSGLSGHAHQAKVRSGARDQIRWRY